MRYLGIDNGKDGALVVLDAKGRILGKYKTPLLKASTRRGKKQGKDEYDIVGMKNILVDLARDDADLFAFAEKAQPMPVKMGGVAANYQRGLSYGLWQGLLVGLGISYEVVSPQAWQKAMLAGIAARDSKQAAAIAAMRLWPKEDWRRSDLGKKPDEGFIDAALIAEYGRRNRAPSP
jgi:hypothetical protein